MSTSEALELLEPPRIEVPTDWHPYARDYGVYKCGHPKSNENTILHGIKQKKKCRFCCGPKQAWSSKNNGGKFRCGHEITDENSVWMGKKRRCKTCIPAIRKINQDRYWAKRGFKCGHPRTIENTRKTESGKASCIACHPGPKKSEKCQLKGHPLTPDNVRLDGGGRRVCLKCESIRRAKKRGRRIIKSAPIDLKLFCKGGHKRTPENTQYDENGNPVRCRECTNARTAQRNRAARLGLEFRVKHTQGMSLAEKIEHYSEPPDENGCRIWNGPTNKGKPWMDIEQPGGTRKRMGIQRYLYEQLHGMPIPDSHVSFAACGHIACVTPTCIRIEERSKYLKRPDIMTKIKRSKRLARGRGRDKYVLPALKYIPKIRQTLTYRYSRTAPGDIEDILQEVLLKFYLAGAEERDSYERVENFEAFVMTVAINTATDWFRLQRNQLGTMVSLDEHIQTHGGSSTNPPATRLERLPAPASADPSREWEEIEREEREHRRLLWRLRSIPPRARQAFKLQIFEDLSQKELATALGISENTVEQHLVKARRSVFDHRKTRRNHVV
jgi:RNA polymerase sigma factor (sigma-70 family)